VGGGDKSFSEGRACPPTLRAPTPLALRCRRRNPAISVEESWYRRGSGEREGGRNGKISVKTFLNSSVHKNLITDLILLTVDVFNEKAV
jgi:hypothetical protein